MISSFHFAAVPPRRPEHTLSQAVVEGLSSSPQSLPCRFFYDDAGSALFEQICSLPEYYPTRTERSILERHADEMIRAAAGDRSLTLIELGSGSSVKTRLLIEAALRRQIGLHYVPIDISGEFLRASAAQLMGDYPPLSVTALAAEYHDALASLPPHGDDSPRLFLFLGSNIGNFCPATAADLLTDLRRSMAVQDRLLVGVDMVKDTAVLESAYNDASGVTAAFNKNLLSRINRELGADFDLNLWSHRAPWNGERSRIEMWLVSTCDQIVTLPDENLFFAFRQGEAIHTENSHKYTPHSFQALCTEAGLAIEERWTDPKGWFASFLVRPAEELS